MSSRLSHAELYIILRKAEKTASSESELLHSKVFHPFYFHIVSNNASKC